MDGHKQLSAFSTAESLRQAHILNEILKVLKESLNPRRIFLFGSRAKGTADARADFDIAIDGESPDRAVAREIELKIEAVIGLYTVDLIYLKNVERKFRDLILKTGKVIYER